MSMVETVTGPVSSDALGLTLMHEHILNADWSMRQCFPDYIDWPKFYEDAVADVNEAAALGVRTICDLTPINLGRDIEVIREVARRTGIQIVVSTGFYFTEEPRLEWWDHDKILSYLLRDLTEGMQGTDVKAGIIKCATDKAGVTELNRKLLEVAARAQRRSGTVISTHTSAAHQNGLLQQDIFEAEGVDLKRVIIGHCGDSQDLEYLEKILRRGSTIGMDRFGIDMLLPTSDRVNTMLELYKRGWAGQMVLSHDASCLIDWFDKEFLRAAAPKWNFKHVPQDVLPALREQGVSEDAIRQMTVENPRRMLQNAGSY